MSDLSPSEAHELLDSQLAAFNAQDANQLETVNEQLLPLSREAKAHDQLGHDNTIGIGSTSTQLDELLLQQSEAYALPAGPERSRTIAKINEEIGRIAMIVEVPKE